MSRVWTKADKELFEGVVTLRVNFSSMYQRKGHGNGGLYRFAFWAVRARKGDDGNEIGLDCGTGSTGLWVEYRDGDLEDDYY
ncbi:hypothetical protein BT96DRAFT_923291 [Gymnopus androsaceus JB14]|uniref:Uncharacterized protein n=1 Tax=Gymnopus androsaceus JB14 TaxID=1447944 RepID=A0A6A4HC05_9AGAR|nr:hypothetical protein BT96DRAFT_923291 [Gymnopus androsaceus JB14]